MCVSQSLRTKFFCALPGASQLPKYTRRLPDDFEQNLSSPEGKGEG